MCTHGAAEGLSLLIESIDLLKYLLYFFRQADATVIPVEALNVKQESLGSSRTPLTLPVKTTPN